MFTIISARDRFNYQWNGEYYIKSCVLATLVFVIERRWICSNMQNTHWIWKVPKDIFFEVVTSEIKAQTLEVTDKNANCTKLAQWIRWQVLLLLMDLHVVH